MKNTAQKKILTSALVASTLLIATLTPANALKIIPSRLVVGPDKNVEYVYIRNDSNQTRSYRFSWKHLAMEKDGTLVNLDDVGRDKIPEYKAADDITRYSPRRTTVKPGEMQRISLLIRRSPSLEAGEYRSHLVVEPEAQAQEEKVAGNEEVNVGVSLLVSRAFPIYILNGETTASLKVNKATLERNMDPKKTPSSPPFNINLEMQKTGNRSIIGTAEAFCGDQKITKVPRIFVIYAEGEYRNEQVAIFPPNGECTTDMTVVIKGHGNDVLAGQTLAEVTVSK